MAMNYSDKVMEHFTNPQNVGEIENASGVGTVGNAKCGDIMKIYIKVEDDVISTSTRTMSFRTRSSRPSAAAPPSPRALWRPCS